jgi:hypothetical protein
MPEARCTHGRSAGTPLGDKITDLQRRVVIASLHNLRVNEMLRLREVVLDRLKCLATLAHRLQLRIGDRLRIKLHREVVWALLAQL